LYPAAGVPDVIVPVYVAEVPESLVVSGVPTAVPVPQSPLTIRTLEVAAKLTPLRTCEHATPRVHAKVTDRSDGPAIDAVPTWRGKSEAADPVGASAQQSL